jgi:hypothetical protein
MGRGGAFFGWIIGIILFFIYPGQMIALSLGIVAFVLAMGGISWMFYDDPIVVFDNVEKWFEAKVKKYES